MDFNKILETVTPEDRDNLTVQALKRQEYNRQYQAKLRQRAKFITLEKKVDANLDYVIGYIKKKYTKEYDNYVEPVQTDIKPVLGSGSFMNWYVLAAATYRSIAEAYSVSGLDKQLTLNEFTKLFKRHFAQTDKGYNKQ